MAVSNVSKAAAYTDRLLIKIGKSRTWVYDFWLDHVEDRRAPGLILDDTAFCEMVVDVQRFLYGDEGDVAMGVPTQAATEREMDGRLGPGTSRRMETWLDWLDEEEEPQPPPTTTSDDCILVGGNRLPVGGGVQIVSLDEEDGRWSLEKYSNKWGSREPTMLGFGHWDVCTSAAKCHSVLRSRRLSSSGCFDNPNADGVSVLYQFLDPDVRRGRHGGRDANRAAYFSFDDTNAVSNKYAERYLKKVGIARPTLHMDKRERLGRGSVFLGMYAAQIRSTLYVLKALSEYKGLPLRFPTRADGTPIGRNYKRIWRDKWDGVATHRHLPSTTKWDIRGFEQQIIVMLLTGHLPMEDFSGLVESFRLHDEVLWDKFLKDFKETCRWAELGIG